MTQNSNLVFDDCFRTLSAALCAKNIVYDVSSRCRKDLNRDEKLAEKKKEYHQLIQLFQKSALECFVYAPQFEDDCYFGQGKYVKSKFIKEGRVLSLDLLQDLWTDMDNFWVGHDWHKTVPRFHPQGDVYFVVDAGKFDWDTFFKICVGFGSVSKIKPYSKAGFTNINKKIGSDNIVIFLLSYVNMIIANPCNLERISYLMSAYNDLSFDISEDSPHVLLFGSEENMKNALDFNCKDYKLSDQFLEYLESKKQDI